MTTHTTGARRLMPTEPMFKNLANLQNNIAADVWPNGGKLSCRQCGHTQPMTTGDAGTYLAKGWPKHCGYTMTIDDLTPKRPADAD